MQYAKSTIKLTDLVNITKDSIVSGTPIDVPCGDCIQCCKPPIRLTAEDQKRLNVSEILPGSSGFCQFLVNDKCTVYENRPQSCRAYDCRPDFIVRAIGINPPITPTTKHVVQIDDENLLLNLLLTTMFIIKMLEADKTLKVATWQSVVMTYEQSYQRLLDTLRS